MSDAAMEATRLAPAGRACSKFVWQSRFLENWAVRMPAHSGRPAFLAITNVNARITNRRRLRRSVLLRRFDLQASNLGAAQAWSHFGPPAAETVVLTFLHDAGLGFLRRGLATLLPRLGVTPRGRNAADGGRLSSESSPAWGATAGGP
jgi:hypothetical protein